MVAYEPDHYWDVYSFEEAREYRALTDGRFCLECGNCAQPEDEEFEGRIGFCTVAGEFVYAHDAPADSECGSFL